MTATHETYHHQANAIESIISDVEHLACRENAHTNCTDAAAVFAAIQIMANRAAQIAEAICRDAMAVQKAEAKQ